MVPHMTMNRVAVTLSLAALAALAIACGSAPTKAAAPEESGDPMPNLDEGIGRAWQARPAIVQTVRLLNPGLRQGDTLRIESTLRNVTDQPVTINRLVCEVEIQTAMQLGEPFIVCAIGLLEGPLAPGEVETRTVSRKVLAPPGRYTVSVHHLLDPDVWVTAELTIHPRR